MSPVPLPAPDGHDGEQPPLPADPARDGAAQGSAAPDGAAQDGTVRSAPNSEGAAAEVSPPNGTAGGGASPDGAVGGGAAADDADDYDVDADLARLLADVDAGRVQVP